jgi:hypothetical protein
MTERFNLMSLREDIIISKQIYMTKNIKYDIKHLKFISRNANGEDVKQKINTIIELYATRKISQVQTASNNIMNLLTTTTVKKKETVNKKYEKLIEKYQAVETLSNRLRQKTTVRNEKKEKQITAASKIQKVTRNKVVFEVEEIAKAFKGKVINLSVRSKTIGSAIATDIDALAARAYLMARRKAPKESEFKVWGSVSFDWISLEGETSFITKSTVSYDSKNINKFFKNLIDIIGKNYGYIILSTLKFEFNFTMIPSGSSCGTKDRNIESVLNKKSVIQIVNDDNNCFWYAMSCLLNPKNKQIRDHRNTKARVKTAINTCNKCKCDWDKPVSFLNIPLVEQTYNCNIYVIDMNNIPMLGSSISLMMNCLMYSSENRHT